MKKNLIRPATQEDAESLFAVHQNAVENLCNADYGFRKIGEGRFSRGNRPVSIEIIRMERAF
ncbi:hypothetical protein ACI77J_23545 [Pseudomonas sp. O64]|uniref:hypothetical protein n=1 Tax=unclassified Pseudomonas TaxID=196821 RepID=UPI001F5A7D78|nr:MULTISPECIES: hypothetical protein [unclassified Pseudomonas]UNM22634.1 hypothetical protein K0P33_14835 [Pseudomonas sp. ArH3a]UXZ25267.1 hypothetical protein KZH41_14190 [Pseudomonas sp. YeP6b]